ncbi:hypothetical protein HYT26_00555 [Candidatus Pacearchaeota archaeon]|nr:hypothetical protein [Candidatus Pacearchaeota archaeon]
MNYIAEKSSQFSYLFLARVYSSLHRLEGELPKGIIESGMLAQHPLMVIPVWAAYKLGLYKTGGKMISKTIAKDTSKNLEEGLEGNKEEKLEKIMEEKL